MKQQRNKKENQPNQLPTTNNDATKPEPKPTKSKPAPKKVEETVKQMKQVPAKEETKPIQQKECQQRVNFKGRVGEFRKDALFRSIPISLQRNVYRETVIE